MEEAKRMYHSNVAKGSNVDEFPSQRTMLSLSQTLCSLVLKNPIIIYDSTVLGAVKIGVGKINAITGKLWKSRTLSLSKDSQNYCPLPRQPYVSLVDLLSDHI